MTYSTSASSAQALAGQAITVRVTGDPDPANNGLFYLHTDHLGSVSAMSDVNGNLVPGSTARYTPFGDWRTEPTANLTDRGFTGHKHNNLGSAPDDIGLIYMNARWFSLILTASHRLTPLYPTRPTHKAGIAIHIHSIIHCVSSILADILTKKLN